MAGYEIRLWSKQSSKYLTNFSTYLTSWVLLEDTAFDNLKSRRFSFHYYINNFVSLVGPWRDGKHLQVRCKTSLDGKTLAVVINCVKCLIVLIHNRRRVEIFGVLKFLQTLSGWLLINLRYLYSYGKVSLWLRDFSIFILFVLWRLFRAHILQTSRICIGYLILSCANETCNMFSCSWASCWSYTKCYLYL